MRRPKISHGRKGKPPLTPVPETPWRGHWGKSALPENRHHQAAGGKKAKGLAGRTAIIGDIVAVMREWWDLPADCNDGELFTYAEMLLDRIEAGEAREPLCRFLAEIQKDRLDIAGVRRTGEDCRSRVRGRRGLGLTRSWARSRGLPAFVAMGEKPRSRLGLRLGFVG